MVNSCCVCGVEQSLKNSHITFHRYKIIISKILFTLLYLLCNACVFSLPKNPNVRKQWLEVLKKNDVKSLIVCTQHFKPEDYREFCDKPILKKDAIPRLDVCELNTYLMQFTENIPM